MNNYEDPWNPPKQKSTNVALIAVSILIIFLLISLWVAFFIIIRIHKQTPADVPVYSLTTLVQTVPPIASSESPEGIIPENGYIFEEVDMIGVSSLTISTKGYEQDCYFILDPISLVDSEGSSSGLTAAKFSETRIFVRADSSVTVLVPEGEYQIYFATGQNWEGHYPLFGRKTDCYVKSENLKFIKTSNGYTNSTITLDPVANGFTGFIKLSGKDDLPK